MRLILLIYTFLLSSIQLFGQQSEARNFVGASLDFKFVSPTQGILYDGYYDRGILNDTFLDPNDTMDVLFQGLEAFNYQTSGSAIRLSSYVGRSLGKRLDIGLSFDVNSRFRVRNYENLKVGEVEDPKLNSSRVDNGQYTWSYFQVFRFPLEDNSFRFYQKKAKHFSLLLAPLIRYNIIVDRRIGLDLSMVYGISQTLDFVKAYRRRINDAGEYEVYLEDFKSDRKRNRHGLGRASLGLTYNFKNAWRFRFRKDLVHFTGLKNKDFFPTHGNYLVFEYQF